MKRLTERDAYWYGEEFWISAKEPDEEEIDEVYFKLKEYEDLEEDGVFRKVECGKWIDISPDYHYGFGNNAYKCSVCNDYYTTEPEDLFFCPRCGAKMYVENENNE